MTQFNGFCVFCRAMLQSPDVCSRCGIAQHLGLVQPEELCSASVDGSHSLPDGTLLRGGRYRVISCTGLGSCMYTYACRDEATNQPVVLHEWFPNGSQRRQHEVIAPFDSQASRQEFLRHANLLQSVGHRSIVAISDIFEQHGTAYIATESTIGEDYETLVARLGAFAVPAAIETGVPTNTLETVLRAMSDQAACPQRITDLLACLTTVPCTTDIDSVHPSAVTMVPRSLTAAFMPIPDVLNPPTVPLVEATRDHSRGESRPAPNLTAETQRLIRRRQTLWVGLQLALGVAAVAIPILLTL
jgi:hypothetical protein